MIQIIFAFLGGVLTVAAPCILPVLPIILGSSVGQNNRLRPLFIVLGFITSFALASLLISVAINYIPWFNQNNVRNIAILLIGLFGIFLLWPRPFEWLMSKFHFISNATAGVGNQQSNTGALILGMTLGLVWAPCAGPILAAILALIAISGSSGKSIILLASYALGAGIPMLIIAYGSQYATTKIRALAQYTTRLQQIFGILIILLALVMFKQYDILLENKLAGLFPQNKIEDKLVNNTQNTPVMNNIKFENYGPVPEFAGISHWINSDPLTMEQLKGKVVLVDFWTYSCINCIRTLPYVTSWYEKYKDKGLVVIGVHTPEFAFEKVADNVLTATKRLSIQYPVAQDNDYSTWQAFNNRYWPAEYLIDQTGNIVYTHFGEGNYDHTENAIRQLLGLSFDTTTQNSILPSRPGSPEMYFKIPRLANLAPEQKPSVEGFNYTLPKNLSLNNFALEGKWCFDSEKAKLCGSGDGKIRLRFSSAKVFMVASASKPVTLKITVDGQLQPNVTVELSQLYTLFDSEQYTDHIIDIEIPESKFEAFTFTFG